MIYIFLNVLCEEAATGGVPLKKLFGKISQIQPRMSVQWNFLGIRAL